MVLSMEKWVGKVAVVTGASSGIGKAIAEDLVKEGIIVAALARRLDRLETLAKETSGGKGKLYPFKCDLTKEEEILSVFKDIIKKLGPISILVNNAGLGLGTTLIDGSIEMWKTVFDTNVIGLSICTREAIASMKANNIKGYIIHINSYAGHHVMDLPFFNVYPATKHAVRALAETLRMEINREKLPIKITNLSPGVVNTEIHKVFSKAVKNDPEKILQLQEPSKFLPNSMEPEDISDAVKYVLSTPDHVNVQELTITRHGQLC